MPNILKNLVEAIGILILLGLFLLFGIGTLILLPVFLIIVGIAGVFEEITKVFNFSSNK